MNRFWLGAVEGSSKLLIVLMLDFKRKRYLYAGVVYNSLPLGSEPPNFPVEPTKSPACPSVITGHTYTYRYIWVYIDTWPRTASHMHVSNKTYEIFKCRRAKNLRRLRNIKPPRRTTRNNRSRCPRLNKKAHGNYVGVTQNLLDWEVWPHATRTQHLSLGPSP